jgi:hypothetical protein
MGMKMGKKWSSMTAVGTRTGKILPYGDEDGNLTYDVEFSINIPTRNMFIPYMKYLAHI